jgi:excisionase family DNA binding protein
MTPTEAVSNRATRTQALPDVATFTEVACYLQVSLETLRYWRKTGSGPRAMLMGKHLRYLRSDVEAWIASRPTSRNA